MRRCSRSGKTIIPIAKVIHGAGAEGEGEGDGLGAYAAPVGVVEISEGETKFVAINSRRKLGIAATVGAAAGMLAGLFMGRGRRRGD